MKKYTSKTPQPIQFELDGEVFIAKGSVPVMRLSELVARDEEDSGIGQLAVIAETYRGLLGDEEYRRFRDHVVLYNTDTATLAQIMNDINDQRSGSVPLERPEPLPTGITNTPTMSKVISPSGEVRWEELSPEKLARLEEAVRRADTG